MNTRFRIIIQSLELKILDHISSSTTTFCSFDSPPSHSMDPEAPAAPEKDESTILPDSTRRSSIASLNPPASTSLISGNLILSSLELIASSKEVRSFKELKSALDIAIDSLKKPLADGESSLDPYIIFTPLRLACESKSTGLMILALDSIGKLVSYDFFIDKNQSESEISLADMITTTVCECFSPSPTSTSSTTTQHDTLLLRLLSSLLSLILSSALSVHQSSLLKAVRTVYNIFLMGSAGTVQTVAQATLGQIVGGVFSRISIDEAMGDRNGHGSLGPSARESRVDLDTVNEDAENGLEDDEVTIAAEEKEENMVAKENGHVEKDEVDGEAETEDGPATPSKDQSEEPITLFVFLPLRLYFFC